MFLLSGFLICHAVGWYIELKNQYFPKLRIFFLSPNTLNNQTEYNLKINCTLHVSLTTFIFKLNLTLYQKVEFIGQTLVENSLSFYQAYLHHVLTNKIFNLTLTLKLSNISRSTTWWWFDRFAANKKLLWHLWTSCLQKGNFTIPKINQNHYSVPRMIINIFKCLKDLSNRVLYIVK